MDDLESTKKKLLEALNEPLNDSSCQSDLENSKKEMNVGNSTLEEADSQVETSIVEENASQNENSVNESETAESTSNSTNVTPKNNSTMAPVFASTSTSKIIYGTPILKSCSPYKFLPSAEKFSKDICDVINFENLPDSTGKYDQMVTVLDKVRETLKKINKE